MDRRFALLLACFFLSGFSALLYQTAWSRELSFVFGTSELAVAAVLAAYMGGLALGAAVAARVAMALRRPVLAYGVLELAVAVSALLVPWGIRGVNAVYVALLGGGDLGAAGSPAGVLVQLAGAFAVLLPPTAFMGATLPLLARHAVRREEQIASRVGLLYAINTTGAIGGTLCAAFWLMPELGLRRTVWVGAALNGVVFLLAAQLARSAPVPPAPPREAAPRPTAGVLWILPAIGLSGAVSFLYEVLWTRLLGHLLGGSVQAFATMLGSFLLGIALGSAVAARLGATRDRAALGFALTQLGIAATSCAAFGLADRLPDLAVGLGAGPASPLPSAAIAVVALLPITLCIGATFPFAVRVLARRPDQAAAATARVYAWNTVGAIAGALGAGFVLLPGLGFEGATTVGVAVNLALAALAGLASLPRRPLLVALAGAAGVALLLVPIQAPWRLLTSSPLRSIEVQGEIAYSGVGRTTSVLLIDWGEKFQILTDGLPEASIDLVGMLPQINVAQWLGALPAVIRPDARELMVVGLGGGVALELVPRTIRSIDVIELEPEVLEANRRVADLRARDPLSDPRVRVHIGDARGSLQLTSRRYDAIVSQPSHPWTAGASHLYTREFFELVRSRLEPEGVFVQWIGIRFVDEALLRSLLATLSEVFPHVELFRPQIAGLLFVASQRPIDALEGAARALEEAPADLARLGLHRVEDVAAARALDDSGVRALAEGVPPNTDDHNRLATRSARLGDASLDAQSTRTLLDPHDPLLSASPLDRRVVVRRLAQLSQFERARSLAMAGEGADEEAGLGWVELAQGRRKRAARHFERALSLTPEDSDALAGRIATRRVPLSRGEHVPGISDVELERPHAAVVAGWRAAQLRDWPALAALEADLAGIEPGHGLFEPATRLRIARRLGTEEPEAAAEAQALAEELLLRRWEPYDSLLRARAAILAGHPRDAWGSLQRIASSVGRSRRGRSLAQRALEVSRDLPDELASPLRLELARRARAAPIP